MANTDVAWQQWGKVDPYFGVLSDAKFRETAIDAHLNEFFETGVNFIDGILVRARKHFDFEPKGRALDFGSGVGRLSIPLAQLFDEVVGVDISPHMLEEAARNAERTGRKNISWLQSDDTLSRVEGVFDLVNSYIVIQHIPIKRGMAFIEMLLDKVAPGGIAALHFSVNRRENPIRRAIYFAQRDVPGARLLVNMFRGNKLREPLMEMNEYSLPDILEMAGRLGFGPALVEPERHGRVTTVRMICRRGS